MANKKINPITQAIEYYKKNQHNKGYSLLIMNLVDKLIELEQENKKYIIQAYEQRAIDVAERNLRSGEDYYKDVFEY